MKNYIIIFILLIGIIELGKTQVPVPANDQDKPVLLVGGTAHLGNGHVIQDAVIGFDAGKLTIVGSASTINVTRSVYEVINVEGQHIYPGFILPNTQLGLIEVSSIRAMDDQSETGELNPNVRSVISYNTDSELPPTMRFNGILLAETTPNGGRISGTSSVMELDGWNWEDAAHSTDIAMHLNWPDKTSRRFDFSTFTVSENPNPNYGEQVYELKKNFAEAKSYGQLSDPEVNLKLEAMQGLFDGSIILMIHASGPKEIVESIKLAQESGVKEIVLVASQDVIYAADFLKDNDIPVILPPVHSLPARPGSDVDLPYKLPHLMTAAGVKVSLSHSGMLSQARNLPFYAGTAVAYGMDKEEVLKCITSNTAEALGIDDRVGTLAIGKDATLFVSKGDALDIMTNQLSHAFISGKQIVLDNKQQDLYKRYSKKYGQMER